MEAKIPTQAHARAAVVTGASRGIGACITETLVNQGYRVAAVGRNQGRLEFLVAGMKPLVAARLTPILADLSSTQQALDLAEEILVKVGVPQIVIHAAGVGYFQRLEHLSTTEWQEMLAVNVTAPFIVTKELLPHMVSSGGGHIVAISSVYEERTGPGMAGYAATKHALKGLMDSLAQECAETTVRVSRVVPTSVRTHFGGRDPASKSGTLEVTDIAAAVVDAINSDPRVASTVIRLEGYRQFGLTSS